MHLVCQISPSDKLTDLQSQVHELQQHFRTARNNFRLEADGHAYWTAAIEVEEKKPVAGTADAFDELAGLFPNSPLAKQALSLGGT
jgi:hypothetical protein